jgi:plastocyanin
MHSPSFALRRGALVALSLLVGIVATACSGGGDGGPGGTATVENGAVEISADDLAFNVGTIEAPAGEDFTITLVNDDSAPHNISIYTEEGGDQLALGPTAEGGQTVTTEVTALEAGEYFFVCDIHPTEMTGTLVVTGG